MARFKIGQEVATEYGTGFIQESFNPKNPTYNVWITNQFSGSEGTS